jgi:hypothetical protein
MAGIRGIELAAKGDILLEHPEDEFADTEMGNIEKSEWR